MTTDLVIGMAGSGGDGIVAAGESLLTAAARKLGVAMHCAHLGGMFTPYFTTDPVTDLATAKRSNTKAHAVFFHGMLKRGFYLPPSQFEVGFVSAAHTARDIDRFVAAARSTLLTF